MGRTVDIVFTNNSLDHHSGKNHEGSYFTTHCVLSIPGGHTYITVEPDQTAESYTAGLRQKYVLALALSAAYILVYLVIWGVILSKKRR